MIRMCTELHFNTYKITGVKLDNGHWYVHVPKSVAASNEGKVTTLWNQQVQTDRTIPSDKLYIVTRDNKQGIRMVIDVTIYGDRNVIKKEAEKILKYKDLIIEIQCMWKVKAKVIPAITGATGTISKSLRHYLRKLSNYIKTAMLCTVHILQNVLI
jgi:hypothetical protein